MTHGRHAQLTTTIPNIHNWTETGANAGAKRTREIIENALRRSVPASYDYDIFLQGSYANATNIPGDSDVDIVVMLKSTYYFSTKRLSEADRHRQEAELVPGTIEPPTWRQAVEKALRTNFGRQEVEAKMKCIKVHGNDSRIDADVAPCFEYRDYTSYPAYGDRDWLRGIKIFPVSGKPIVNYPKEHIDNGQRKKGRAPHYKDTVRQIKRLKQWANSYSQHGGIDLPGYVIECMTYNLPDWMLSHGPNRERLGFALSTFIDADRVDLLGYTSCDEVHRLFVTDPGEHDATAAQQQMLCMYAALVRG